MLDLEIVILDLETVKYYISKIRKKYKYWIRTYNILSFSRTIMKFIFKKFRI